MNLTNDTYIQRTLKGDKALLQKPPIPFKLRALLHEIPQLGRKEFFLRKDLLKVSDLYVKSNSDDPIGFFKQINDVYEKGWIDVVSDEQIEPIDEPDDFNNERNEDKNIFSETKNDTSTSNESYDVLSVYEKEDELLTKDESQNISSNNNDEVVDVENEDLSDMNSDIARWVEENKEEKEEEVPIPWTNPFMTLEDYLKSDNTDSAYEKKGNSSAPVKKEFVKNKEEYAPDFINSVPWDANNHNDVSSGSKTKEEKFKEQMDLLKAEQRRKSKKTERTETTETNKKNKKKNEEESSGISSFINKLFGKK